ncbi:MAG: hypothetical protein HKN79_09220 [Flavobacteriales bacterium]|nr:hypothetical protein [Flavobacteriales bacterium]
MKHLLTLMLLLGSATIAHAQKGIVIGEYEMKIEWPKDQLESLENPLASTDCDRPEINWIFVDKQFSGGENGVIERTWMAEDACGNKASTVQYIVLKE